MSRWKAAAYHLSISAAAGTLVVGTMLAVWYPGPFFTAMGGNDFALTVIAAALALGPLLTLIVFSPGKRPALLRLDLAIIGTLQACALAFGIHVVAEARPIYLVFAFDRFEVVAADELREEELARVTDPQFRDVPWGRPRTVGVRKPRDPNEQLRVMLSGLAGADLPTFPQYYVPYEKVAQAAAARSVPLAELRRRQPGGASHIADVLRSLQRSDADTRFLPLHGSARDYCVLLDPSDGRIVGFVEVYPW